MCRHFAAMTKGGRPQKNKQVPRQLCGHIRSCAGPRLRATFPLTPDRFFPPHGSLSLADLQCSICRHIVDEPVELPCKVPACADCCIGLAQKGDITSCPSCQQCHDTTTASFQPVSSVHMKLLSHLVLKCDCGKSVLLGSLAQHLSSGCREMVAEVASAITVEQILEQPLDAPTTSLEKQAAGHLVRKMLHQSSNPNTITVPTGGHVCRYSVCVQVHVESVGGELFTDDRYTTYVCVPKHSATYPWKGHQVAGWVT